MPNRAGPSSADEHWACSLHAATYRRDGKLRCLLDDFAVSYVPSARVLAATGSAPSAQPGLVPVLAGVGDPASAEPSLPFARAEMKEISAYLLREATCLLRQPGHQGRAA